MRFFVFLTEKNCSSKYKELTFFQQTFNHMNLLTENRKNSQAIKKSRTRRDFGHLEDEAH